MAYPESWQEVAMLTIKNGTQKTNFALITESFDINNGDKAIEGLPTVSGGRIIKWTPEGDTEVTCKIVPVGVGKTTDTSADGFWQLFHPQTAAQDAFPQTISESRSRNTYSVAVMWTPTIVSDAFTSTAASVAGFRYVFKNAYITKLTHTFTTSDGLMADMTIKCAAFDKTGAPNVLVHSTDGSSALANLL